MSNLIEIQSQIEKLQKQASEIKSREFAKTVDEIRAKMEAFGITLKDLRPAVNRRAGERKAKGGGQSGGKRAKSNGVRVEAKYRGPNGETWSGRGLMPRWLSALVAQGQSKDAFAIKK
jgi:DNA-binding protein H-NS